MSLILLFILILDPISKKDKVITHATNILVLIDSSASMGVEDFQNESRLELVQEFLDKENFIKEDIKHHFQFKYFKFGREPVSIEEKQVKRLQPDGEMTGLVRAVKSVYDENAFGNIGGMLLFSDGIENISINPEDQIEQFGSFRFPVIVYGIGDYYRDLDVSVTQLIVPEIFYKNEKGIIKFSIRALNLAGEDIEIRTKIDSEKFKEFKFNPESNSVTEQFEIEYIPDHTGEQEFEVAVSGNFEEDNTRDNRISGKFLVKKPYNPVLYLEFKPGWDSKFTRRLLSSNKRIKLTSLIFDLNGNIISTDQGGPQSALELDLNEFKFIVLGHPQAGIIEDKFFRDIRRQVRNKGAALLILLGGSDNLPQEIARSLPFNVERKYPPENINMELTDEGKFHPVLRDLKNLDLLELPKLKSSLQLKDLGKGVQVLAQTYHAGDNHMSNPVILESKLGLGKMMVISAEGLWQWQFLVSGVNIEENFWNRTLERISRYMIDDKNIKNIAILPLPNNTVTAQRFLLRIRVLDQVYFPVVNPDINLNLIGPENETKLSVIPSDSGEGIFETEIDLKKPGKYTVNLSVTDNDRELGSDSADFEVERFDIEVMNKSKNDVLLKKIAYITGGVYFDGVPDRDISELLKDYSTTEQIIDINRVWDNFPIFILIVFILGLEWYLRKKYGLS